MDDVSTRGHIVSASRFEAKGLTMRQSYGTPSPRYTVGVDETPCRFDFADLRRLNVRVLLLFLVFGAIFAGCEKQASSATKLSGVYRTKRADKVDGQPTYTVYVFKPDGTLYVGESNEMRANADAARSLLKWHTEDGKKIIAENVTAQNAKVLCLPITFIVLSETEMFVDARKEVIVRVSN